MTDMRNQRGSHAHPQTPPPVESSVDSDFRKGVGSRSGLNIRHVPAQCLACRAIARCKRHRNSVNGTHYAWPPRAQGRPVVLVHPRSGHAHERCDASKSVKSVTERCRSWNSRSKVGDSVSQGKERERD